MFASQAKICYFEYMSVEHLKAIDVADLMISRVQNLCLQLRQTGFPKAANDLEDDFIKLYDRLLPFLASGDFDNPELLKIGDDMLDALNKVENVTCLVDFKDRIMKAFYREG